MNMKFSIITVCFNSEKTIEDTMESVIKQNYSNYEHIIIDGKSTDKTLEIITRYMKNDKRIKLISEKDHGIYNAMNKGIKLATGDLIVFLNSDDTFEINSLQLIYDNYEDDVDIIYGDVYIEEKFKNYIFEKKRCLSPNSFKENESNKMIFSTKHLNKIIYAHNATFIKTSIMKENLFDEQLKICSDFKFFLQMFKKGLLVKYIPYRITNMKIGGISTTNLILTAEEHYKCELEVLGYSNINLKKRKFHIKVSMIIKKIIKNILSDKFYIKLRYLNRGWILKN